MARRALSGLGPPAHGRRGRLRGDRLRDRVVPDPPRLVPARYAMGHEGVREIRPQHRGARACPVPRLLGRVPAAGAPGVRASAADRRQPLLGLHGGLRADDGRVRRDLGRPGRARARGAARLHAPAGLRCGAARALAAAARSRAVVTLRPVPDDAHGGRASGDLLRLESERVRAARPRHRGQGVPGGGGADRNRVRVAPPRAARRADLPGRVRRRAARLLPAVPGDRPARSLVGRPRPGESPAPARERRGGGVPGGASARRAAPLVLLHSQLRQPRRSPGAHVRRGHELVPALEPAGRVGAVRARPGHPRAIA